MALPRLRRAAGDSAGVLLLVTVLAASAGCATKVYREGAPPITGKVGDLVTVELASDPTTGYSWQLVGQYDVGVLTLMETDYGPSPSPGLGTAGYQRWTFRLVGRGSTAITFAWGRTWANVPAEKATMFTVTAR